jgi:hypothetical protein
MENLKDKITTISGLLFVICGAVLGVQTQYPLPKCVVTIAAVLASVCAAVTMYMTGKNPNGTTKTSEQAAAINNLAK